MVHFDAAHRAVHVPGDRRFRIWLRPSIIIGIAAVMIAVFTAAWIEVAVGGLPTVPEVPQSFGDGLYGGTYYETQTIENLIKAECLLATHMNGQPLPHVYGAPIRLRVENQLGYKMVKWIERIEFVRSEKELGAAKAERTRTTSISTSCLISDASSETRLISNRVYDPGVLETALRSPAISAPLNQSRTDS